MVYFGFCMYSYSLTVYFLMSFGYCRERELIITHIRVHVCMCGHRSLRSWNISMNNRRNFFSSGYGVLLPVDLEHQIRQQTTPMYKARVSYAQIKISLIYLKEHILPSSPLVNPFLRRSDTVRFSLISFNIVIL